MDLSIEFTVVQTLVTLTNMKDTSLLTKGRQDLHDPFVHIRWLEDKSDTQDLCEFIQTYVDKYKDQLADVTTMNSVPKMKGG